MANENLHISQSGLDLIKTFEGCVLRVYFDSAKKKTIGVGHLLTEAELSSNAYEHGISLSEAYDLLRHDVIKSENLIKTYIKAPLSQNSFDALCSFVFNVGGAAIAQGGVGKAINSNNFSQVPSEMLKWCHVGSVVNEGLLERRKKEAALFSTPDITIPQPAVVVQNITVPQIDPTPASPTILPTEPAALHDNPIELNVLQSIFSFVLNLFKR